MDCSIRMEGAARVLEPAGAVAEAAPILDRVASVRGRVFHVVRSLMPIDTLFTPELKIDLARFIEDQELFVSIADFLSRTGTVTKEDVAKSFEGHELEKRIAEQFKNDAPRYLDLFYENCARALQSKDERLNLKSVFEGRIFTLKNGLVAQHQPPAIQKSQKTNGLKPQGIEVIQKGGANFIEQSIRFYLAQVERREEASFVEELTRVANGLIPFLQTLTRSYLLENKIESPLNPLMFRNPTGYNRHGLVAAILLEAALKSLGFNAKFMVRSDLEPKVTLATAHGIVVVTSPDGKEFIVDPTYTQFHEDLYPGSGSKLESPVLILERGAVKDYIEQNFMRKWDAIYKLVKDRHEKTCETLKKGDCLLQYTIGDYKMPIEGIVSHDVKEWVSGAYTRIWDLDSYHDVLSNKVVQELFFRDGVAKKVCEKIQGMNLFPLLDYRSDANVISELRKMDGTGENRERYLSLLASLPRLKRVEFLSKLDVDPRENGDDGLNPIINAYFHEIRRVVNPDNGDFKVIYGCSGADITSVCFSTNATDLVFVDMTEVDIKDFKSSVGVLKQRSLQEVVEYHNKLGSSGFLGTRSRYSGSSSGMMADGKQMMPDLALRLMYGLEKMGVDLGAIKIEALPNKAGFTLNFEWQHHHDKFSKKRCLTFITADITKPDSYPPILKKQIESRFDAFFMKASFMAPLKYGEFLPQLAEHIQPNGFLMTTDKTFVMQPCDPSPGLEEKGLTFTKTNPPVLKIYQSVLEPPFDPLVTIGALSRRERHNRTPGSDENYWTVLTLRQKSG